MSAASRASIKRAVLAARILNKSDGAEAREAKGGDPRPEDSKPAEAGFRGGSVASKTRIRRQLSGRSGSGPLSLPKSRSFEEEHEHADAGNREALESGGHLRLEDLDQAVQKNKSQEAHSAPVFGGLAALKVKHRLQALHQEAKKKQPMLPSIGPANLSVTNATAAEKTSEVPAPTTNQNPANNGMAALVSAARTTLPKFASGATALEEEAEIKALLGEVDADLLDLIKEVNRTLAWLFNDSDTDFDNKITYSQLKAMFHRPGAPLGPSLALEVDSSTTSTEKDDLCSRLRFLEIFILVCIRVNQSPILTSRLQDAKRDMSRGLAFSRRGSKSGSALLGSSSDLERVETKVSMLAGIPRMNVQSNAHEKWESTVRRLSAVMLGTGRRASAEHGDRDKTAERPEPEPPSPLAKLEKLFATHLP